ncbi:MAG: glucose-6-phosphate dehydrogenase assembly protein OpcA [Gloeobacterales cyanobacterium]
MSAVVPLSDVQTVPVASIEQELRHIWSEAGATRAATFNLMIYRPVAPVGGLDEVVGVVTAQNPCRAIVLFPSEEKGLSAQVGAYCPASGGKSASVCCEYITLQVGTNAPLGQLRSLLLSLLIPDLPAVLWWDAPINVEDALFKGLEDLSERLVFDSAQLKNPVKEMPPLADRIHAAGSSRVFSDLNWSRLSPWRELSAQAFDDPTTREALFSLNRIDVQYGKPFENEAWLYLVWLTSRLDWTYKSHDATETGLLLHFLNGDAQLDVNFEEAQTPEQEPFSAHLVSNQFGTTVIRSSDEGHHGCLQIDMEGRGTSQVCQLAPDDEDSLEQLLSHDLYTRKQDHLWEEVVVATAEIYRSLAP